jgi:hypothetical protein
MGIAEAVEVIDRGVEEDAVDVVDAVQVVNAVDTVVNDAIHPVQNIPAIKDDVRRAGGSIANTVQGDDRTVLERKRQGSRNVNSRVARSALDVVETFEFEIEFGVTSRIGKHKAFEVISYSARLTNRAG